MSIFSRLSHGWKAFVNNKDPTNQSYALGYSDTSYPDRIRLTKGNERSIINSILTRIAVDASSIDIRHVRTDENGRYTETIDSYLNDCLSLSPNKDQTARTFFRDVILSMFDEGVVAIVVTGATSSPENGNSYDVQSMRVGRITEWFPDHVRVNVYNEVTGRREELILPKSIVAIVENPFYSVMNEPNSTLNRLIRKLNILDNIDEKTGSNKFNLIFQLPYVTKSQIKREQSEQRLQAIENQLVNSKYGIAYVDATEKVIQLNRPVENDMLSQIEYLTNMLYNQFGVTTEVFNGTADEAAMINYNNRTIEPILSAITEEMKRKFLTKTARTQGQSIMFFRDPFKLVPVSQIADIADKFTRNEILSSNDIRAIMGFKPSDDPRADELRNKNLNDPNAEAEPFSINENESE